VPVRAGLARQKKKKGSNQNRNYSDRLSGYEANSEGNEEVNNSLRSSGAAQGSVGKKTELHPLWLVGGLVAAGVFGVIYGQ